MKKIPIWKNVALIVSTLVIIIIATLAWFITGNFGQISDLLLSVGDASYILISGDGGDNWSEDLNISLNIHQKFKEISGDGIDFYQPVYEFVEKSDGKYTQDLINFEKVNDDSYYFEQLYVFKTDADYDVYLSPESNITSVAGKENGYIQGAMRVAFFEIDDNGNEVLKCIWAPNSKIEYSKDTNSFKSNGSVENRYYYQKTSNPVDISNYIEGEDNPDIDVITTDNTDEFGCGYSEKYKFMWSNGNKLPDNAPSLLRIRLSESDNTKDKKMKIKVWLEGHDRECVSLLSGKEFTLNFRFDARKENIDE